MVEPIFAGVAQLARASAFQAEGRGFESRLPLIKILAKAKIFRGSSTRHEHAGFFVLETRARDTNPPSVDCADVAQLVEHLHGKEVVTGSNPVIGS